MPQALTRMIVTRRSAPWRSSGRGCARAWRINALRTARNTARLADMRRVASLEGRRHRGEGAATRRASPRAQGTRSYGGREPPGPAVPSSAAMRRDQLPPHRSRDVRHAALAGGLRLGEQGGVHEPQVARRRPAGRAPRAVPRLAQPRGGARDDDPQARAVGAHADAPPPPRGAARGDLARQRLVHLRRRAPPRRARVVGVAVQAAAARAGLGRAVRRRAVVPAASRRARSRSARTSPASSPSSRRTPSTRWRATGTSRRSTGCSCPIACRTRGSTARARSRVLLADLERAPARAGLGGDAAAAEEQRDAVAPARLVLHGPGAREHPPCVRARTSSASATTTTCPTACSGATAIRPRRSPRSTRLIERAERIDDVILQRARRSSGPPRRPRRRRARWRRGCRAAGPAASPARAAADPPRAAAFVVAERRIRPRLLPVVVRRTLPRACDERRAP